MASKIYVVVCRWLQVDVVDGDGVCRHTNAMVPIARYAGVADRQFAEGEEYPIAPVEPRSRASHNHYFAALGNGFDNLPEAFAARFPTPEHLRHWLLIETDWCDEFEFEMASQKQAEKLAARIRADAPFARINIMGNTVIRRDAKSQSAAAMGKEAFEASKKDVLDLLEHIIGVGRGALMKEAKRIR